jgi:hypothetical protein
LAYSGHGGAEVTLLSGLVEQFKGIGSKRLGLSEQNVCPAHFGRGRSEGERRR